MYNILKVGNFRTDFNPYELCTQTYTQKYSHLNTENTYSGGTNDFFTTFDKYYFALKRLKTRGKYAISRENLANESLRNCDVRQVLYILTIFCRFKPKNVCILQKFLSFQSFQSKIILVKCCKEVIVPPE